MKNGADKGSGALWNNNPENAGRFPLVKTDKPIGQWNTLRIVMTGNRASIWMNGKQTVDDQVMDNYFNPGMVKPRPSWRADRSSCRRTALRCGSATSSSRKHRAMRPRRWRYRDSSRGSN